MSNDVRSALHPIQCASTGLDVLGSPHLNKGSAFTLEERRDFRLTGLLPSCIDTLEEQAQRAIQQYRTHRTDMERNVFLTSMKEQNTVLYYRLLQDNLKEMFSIIYTPTEGEAIANYSSIFRRSEGCFLNILDPDGIEASLAHWKPEDVDIIVCSDGEQILGIGDQGVGAILISIAKLALYTLCAGVNPRRTLPVVLDVGTNNTTLLNDPLYLGLRRPRFHGEVYDAFIQKFLQACQTRFPKAYIHFEDFGLSNARRILDQYSPQFACFNDDIQGTGAVTLAAIYAAVQTAKTTPLQDIRVVVFGAGTAGIGIADQIRDAIASEGNKSRDEAARQIWTVDKFGIVLEDERDLSEAQRAYAKPGNEWAGQTFLLYVIRIVKPHVLIGTSTKPRSFTQEIVQEMAKHVDRPIILPLSNPSRLHEAVPSDLIQVDERKSPNGDWISLSSSRIRRNNIRDFGVLVTANLLVAAVKALALQAPAVIEERMGAGLLPDVTQAREISAKVAAAVIKQAVNDGLARRKVRLETVELEEWIRDQMWEPQYSPLVRA